MLFTDLDSDDVRLIGAVDLEWLQTRSHYQLPGAGSATRPPPVISLARALS